MKRFVIIILLLSLLAICSAGQEMMLTFSILADPHLSNKADHAERLARIAESQADSDDQAARGVPDKDGDTASGSKEKSDSKDTTQNDVVTNKQRGPAK
jgi:hypothetical protein